MATEIQIGRVFVDKCMALHLEGKLDVPTAAMAKYWATDLQCKVLDECVQLHGGYGFMWEYPIARAWADARVQRIYAGTNEIMKGKYQLDEANSFNAMAQYYEGQADMPGGLNVKDYKADPYQSTRPYDKFWGRRTMFNAGYRYQEDRREFTVNTFFTTTLRNGYLDQTRFLSLSPREYWVRGLESRFAQGFDLGNTSHEVGVGYRYINEAGHELRYTTPISANQQMPTTNSKNDRDTRGSTEANAFFIDDRIDIGKWTITPGVRPDEELYYGLKPDSRNKGQIDVEALFAIKPAMPERSGGRLLAVPHR